MGQTRLSVVLKITLLSCVFLGGAAAPGGTAPSAAATTATPPVPQALASLGDSITSGWGSGLDGAGENVPGDNTRGSWATGSDPSVDSHAQHVARLLGSPPATVDLAAPGRRVTDDDGLMAQASQVPGGTDYVLIGTGTTDVCHNQSVDQMTPLADFKRAVETALTTLTTSLPGVHILVSSIPNWNALWQVEPAATAAAGACPLLFSPDPTIANAATRLAVQQQTVAYNQALSDACSEFAPACRYDGGAAYGVALTPADVSTVDSFHPSLAGQAKLAAATWAASWWAGDAMPVNVSPPEINGLAAVGATLASDGGDWSGNPAPELTTQWLRCDANGVTCLPIAGESATTHAVTTADVGATLRVHVTATSTAGSASATSVQSTVVPQASAAPRITTMPTISGVAQRGQTLTGDFGTWTGTPTSLRGEWLRCNFYGFLCSSIPGAAGVLYTPVDDDVGHMIRFRVTATNAAGSSVISSQATRTVATVTNPLRLEIIVQNPSVYTVAVDRNGVAYGSSALPSDPLYRLYRSFDEGRTWTPLYDFPSVSKLAGMSVLSDNTLLAFVIEGGVMHLFRSGDSGLSWVDVFRFYTSYQVLTADSIADDGTYVYVATYNVLDGSNHTNWIWRSADDGRTWSVVHTTTTHRHAHFIRVDPSSGAVYVGYGDSPNQAAIERSTDRGVTWSTLCGGDDCLSVDLAFDPAGFAIFGTDTPNSASGSYIRRLDLATGQSTAVAALAGPSYSSFNLGGGVWLIGETHEPNGSYRPGDTDLHLFGSNDGGETFNDVLDVPFTDPTTYDQMMVQFAFPSGHFPVQIAQPGGSTLVARVQSDSPLDTALPAVSGSARTGAGLTATQGAWTGSPASYAYRWQRCPIGGLCADIAGATSPSYVLTQADVGALVRVGVTASNASGSTVSFSVPVGPVQIGIVVSSSIASGQTLTGRVSWTAAVTGLPSGTTASVRFSIDGVAKWTENQPPYVFNGDGQTLDTSTLANGSHTFTLLATASNGSVATVTSTALVVNLAPPQNTGLPTISGSARVGATLTATTGTWTNAPTSFAYQWQRCNSSGTSCAPISNAIGASYAVVTADAGSTLRVAVTARNATASTTAVSTQTAVVVVVQTSCPAGQILAQYFSNRTLTGTPSFTRCETSIDHDWGYDGPGNGVPSDNFSARWTGTVTTPSGRYTLRATADDGIRIWVDGRVVLDKWFDQSATTYTVSLSVSSGQHSFVVEYYEHTGRAAIVIST